MASEKKAKKKHLHEIRTQAADDGAYVHHHTYKGSKEDAHTEPERMNVATSGSPEEAGNHIADSFAQNEGAQQPGQPEAGEQGEPGEGGQAEEGMA